jgi:hypothetical protein
VEDTGRDPLLTVLPRATPTPYSLRVRRLAIAVLVLACSPDGAPAPAPSPDEQAPTSAPETRPVALPLQPITCHKQPDLPSPPLDADVTACDGVAPITLREPVEVSWAVAADRIACGVPDSDAAGNVAAGGYWFYVGEELLLWRADGTRFPSPEVPRPAAISVLEGLAGGPHGFVVDALFAQYRLVPNSALTPLDVRWPADVWTYIGHSYEAPYSAVPDGHGGLLTVGMGSRGHRTGPYGLWATHVHADGTVDGPWVVAEFDWQPAPEFPPLPYWAVSSVAIGAADDHVLVVWRGDLADAACGAGTLVGRWFTCGVPDGPVFFASAEPQRVRTPSLVPLADGSLVLGGEGTWERRFVPGIDAGGPPPEWLLGSPLAVVSGGRATAILSAHDEVSVVARNGRVCGATHLPSASEVMLPVIGYDGTLIQFTGHECADDGRASCCNYRWWSRAASR